MLEIIQVTRSATLFKNLRKNITIKSTFLKLYKGS